MLKIAIDCRELEKIRFGIGRFVKGIIDYLNNYPVDIDITLIVYEGYDKTLFDLSKYRLMVFKKNYPLIILDHIIIPIELKKHTIDLFYSPYYKIPIRGRFKKIGMIHDLNIIKREVGYPLWKRLLYRYLFKFYSRQMNKIVTDSNYSKQDIINYLKVDEKKVKVISIPLDKIFLIDSAPGREQQTRDIFLFVGNILKHKNIEFLLKVYSKLETSIRKRYKLILAGKINDYYKKRLERLGYSFGLGKEEFEFSGFVSEEELVNLYRRAKIFLFPSLLEGFGVPVVEAQAMGVPVIASDRTSIPEVACNAAVLLNPYNVDEWVETILKLLNNENFRDELIKRGKSNVSRFSLDKIGLEFFDFIRNQVVYSNSEPQTFSQEST
ncbi:MAG: glycosyltransferase family 1 protein [Candidatus Hydrogenedentota bacterium]